jgi:hypothetical protein
MAHLVVTLAPATAGIEGVWLLDGVELVAGALLAQLPVSNAGAPTVRLRRWYDAVGRASRDV